MSDDEGAPFDIQIWYPDEYWMPVEGGLSSKDAVERAKRLIDRLDPFRVTITDVDDNTVFLWERGKGVVYPTREQLAEARG